MSYSSSIMGFLPPKQKQPEPDDDEQTNFFPSFLGRADDDEYADLAIDSASGLTSETPSETASDIPTDTVDDNVADTVDDNVASETFTQSAPDTESFFDTEDTSTSDTDSTSSGELSVTPVPDANPLDAIFQPEPQAKDIVIQGSMPSSDRKMDRQIEKMSRKVKELMSKGFYPVRIKCVKVSEKGACRNSLKKMRHNSPGCYRKQSSKRCNYDPKLIPSDIE